VVLALDPDPAGQAAAARTSLSALAEVTRLHGRRLGAAGALELLIARLPDDRDPDELIQGSPDMWEASLANAIPAFDFYFEQTMNGLDRTGEAWRQEAIDRLLPLVQQFAMSAGWQAIWLQRLSQETGIDMQALGRTIPAGRQAGKRPTAMSVDRPGRTVAEDTTSRALTSDPGLGIEEALLALLLRIVVVPEKAGEELRDAGLQRPEHRALSMHC
jgi:DNA primase